MLLDIFCDDCKDPVSVERDATDGGTVLLKTLVRHAPPCLPRSAQLLIKEICVEARPRCASLVVRLALQELQTHKLPSQNPSTSESPDKKNRSHHL